MHDRIAVPRPTCVISADGRLALLDVVRLTAHDAHHHVWDIEGSLTG
jgi:hypothetical protein